VALRVISNVPEDKLKTILTDLEYEVSKANIKKTDLQPDGLFRIEYDPDQTAPSTKWASNSQVAR
jgi:hypothetical protein